jgi:transposase
VVEKLELVQESLQPGMNVSYVARRHGISPSLLFRWRKLMSDGGKVAVQADDQVIGAGEIRALQTRVRDLERMLGKNRGVLHLRGRAKGVKWRRGWDLNPRTGY